MFRGVPGDGLFISLPARQEQDEVNIVLEAPENIISVDMKVVLGNSTSVSMYDANDRLLFSQTVREHSRGSVFTACFN